MFIKSLNFKLSKANTNFIKEKGRKLPSATNVVVNYANNEFEVKIYLDSVYVTATNSIFESAVLDCLDKFSRGLKRSRTKRIDKKIKEKKNSKQELNALSFGEE